MNDYKKSFIASTVITGVMLILLWLLCPIMFQNNDDKFLLYMIAGYMTGAPSLHTVFGGFLWAGFISLFYRIYSGIAWYTLISLALIVISLIIICATFIKSNIRNGIVYGGITFIGVFCLCLCYFSTAIQYTMTSAYAGVAGICMLLMAKWEEKPGIRRICIALSALLITISYSVRKEMGLVTVSCAVIILFFMLFGKKRTFALKAGSLILLSFLIIYGSNALYEHITGLDQFNKDYSIVQRWIDYPHIDIEDDPEEIYASVGWDKALYDAATEWFFLDERVNSESIKTINDASSKIRISFEERLQKAKDTIANKQIVNLQVCLWIYILVVANIVLLKTNRDQNNLLALLCADALFLFFGLLAIYFCVFQGRFPLRVYQALVLIYFIPSLIIVIRQLSELNCSKVKYLFVATTVLLVLACYRFYPVGSMLYQAKLATHDTDRQRYIEQVTSLEEYAAEHKENLYIYDYELSQPSAPFVTFKKSSPYNILYWGGWTYGSPVYYEQLKANGRTDLTPEDLIGGNVYLCGISVDETIQRYMESVFGTLKVEIVDRTGDVIIYRYCK